MKTFTIPTVICAALVAGCTSSTSPTPGTGHAAAATSTKTPAELTPAEISALPTPPNGLSNVPAPAEIEPNRYVIYAPDGSSEITIDTTKAEEMKDWAQHRLAPVLAEWYPKISAMIPTPGFTPPKRWNVKIAPGNGVAATGGTNVTANLTWFVTQMDKTGPFSANEIKKLSGIVERVRKQSDPISAYLWKRLSAAQQAALKNYQASEPKEAQDVILETFNKILEEPCIYDPARFKGVTLTYETISLLHQSPKDVELSHPNRLLLQDAYVQELSRTHKEGVGALLHEEVHVVQQYGSARRNNVPGNFSNGDITNFDSLTKKIQGKTDIADPVAAFLYKQLTPEERKALAGYKGPGSTAWVWRTNLVGALNRIISGPAIYNEALFGKVTLRESTTTLRDTKPEGRDLARLNRFLLEDAFPGDLARMAVTAAGGGRRGGGGGGGGANTGWLTEGIPDFIRWFYYQPEAHGADFVYFQKKADPKYDGAYRPSAYFLNYVTTNYDVFIVKKVSDAIRQGKYYNDIWSDNTGKSLQELNQEWLDMFHKAKAAAAAAAANTKT